MKHDEIRAANRKALPKFLLFTLVCAVIGGIAGYCADTGVTSCPAFWRTQAHSSARTSPHG